MLTAIQQLTGPQKKMVSPLVIMLVLLMVVMITTAKETQVV
jgi:hypothetical protein